MKKIHGKLLPELTLLTEFDPTLSSISLYRRDLNKTLITAASLPRIDANLLLMDLKKEYAKQKNFIKKEKIFDLIEERIVIINFLGTLAQINIRKKNASLLNITVSPHDLKGAEEFNTLKKKLNEEIATTILRLSEGLPKERPYFLHKLNTKIETMAEKLTKKEILVIKEYHAEAFLNRNYAKLDSVYCDINYTIAQNSQYLHNRTKDFKYKQSAELHYKLTLITNAKYDHYGKLPPLSYNKVLHCIKNLSLLMKKKGERNQFNKFLKEHKIQELLKDQYINPLNFEQKNLTRRDQYYSEYTVYKRMAKLFFTTHPDITHLLLAKATAAMTFFKKYTHTTGSQKYVKLVEELKNLKTLSATITTHFLMLLRIIKRDYNLILGDENTITQTNEKSITHPSQLKVLSPGNYNCNNLVGKHDTINTALASITKTVSDHLPKETTQEKLKKSSSVFNFTITLNTYGLKIIGKLLIKNLIRINEILRNKLLDSKVKSDLKNKKYLLFVNMKRLLHFYIKTYSEVFLGHFTIFSKLGKLEGEHKETLIFYKKTIEEYNKKISTQNKNALEKQKEKLEKSIKIEEEAALKKAEKNEKKLLDYEEQLKRAKQNLRRRRQKIRKKAEENRNAAIQLIEKPINEHTQNTPTKKTPTVTTKRKSRRRRSKKPNNLLKKVNNPHFTAAFNCYKKGQYNKAYGAYTFVLDSTTKRHKHNFLAIMLSHLGRVQSCFTEAERLINQNSHADAVYAYDSAIKNTHTALTELQNYSSIPEIDAEQVKLIKTNLNFLLENSITHLKTVKLAISKKREVLAALREKAIEEVRLETQFIEGLRIKPNPKTIQYRKLSRAEMHIGSIEVHIKKYKTQLEQSKAQKLTIPQKKVADLPEKITQPPILIIVNNTSENIESDIMQPQNNLNILQKDVLNIPKIEKINDQANDAIGAEKWALAAKLFDMIGDIYETFKHLEDSALAYDNAAFYYHKANDTTQNDCMNKALTQYGNILKVYESNKQKSHHSIWTISPIQERFRLLNHLKSLNESTLENNIQFIKVEN